VKALAFAWLFAGAALAAQVKQLPIDKDIQERGRKEALQHYRFGEEALRGERFDEAEREFRKSAQLDPRLELAPYGLGRVYMATKRYRDAIGAYTKCREVFRDNASMTLQDESLGQRRVDDQIRALEDTKQMYESGTGNNRTVNAAVTIQNLQTQINELRTLRRRGSYRPEDVPAWISLALGSAYFRANAMADAEREFRETLRAQPKLGEAHNNLALVYMLTGRYDEADREIKAAEKSGFAVNPQFKEDLKKAMSKR
jgi:tetratricopeptide (TPR) repeat protein